MPDDGLAGRTIQPALQHIEFASPAHSCVKETSQLCNGGARRSDIAEMCALFGPDPVRIRTLLTRQTTRRASLPLMCTHNLAQSRNMITLPIAILSHILDVTVAARA